MNEESDWISLMDYATKYDVSLSTLRRHIKAGKIQYKVENGRYLLRSPFASGTVGARSGAPRPEAAGASSNSSSHMPSHSSQASPASGHTTAESNDLRMRLQRAQEEIAELKMLVALYEEQLSSERPGQGQLRMNGH